MHSKVLSYADQAVTILHTNLNKYLLRYYYFFPSTPIIEHFANTLKLSDVFLFFCNDKHNYYKSLQFVLVFLDSNSKLFSKTANKHHTLIFEVVSSIWYCIINIILLKFVRTIHYVFHTYFYSYQVVTSKHPMLIYI
jgi:hypothetical protein